MKADRAAPHRIVVIGGGVSGALFVYHLLRAAKVPIDITILEPRDQLGRGVAYSAAGPFHITNVPASRMVVDPEDPGQFVRWLNDRSGAPPDAQAGPYPPRSLFGDYIGELVRVNAARRPEIRVVHRRECAESVGRNRGALVVRTKAGDYAADAVALATGNPRPQLPPPLQPVAAAPLCILDPWAPEALSRIPPEARVLIVGTGLTMADAVVALREGGHRGEVLAVSRRGQLPRRGLVEAVTPFGTFDDPPRTALALLRLFRGEVRRAEAAGTTWHAVLVAARARGLHLWRAMPASERRRFVRHLRLFWELHRHVMPGPVHTIIENERSSGGLRVLAGCLMDVRSDAAGFDVEIRPRGTATVQRQRFDAVINCTGPAYASLTRTDPLWSALAEQGLVRPDAAGIGIDADACGRAVDLDGHAASDLFLLGTLARSAFGELTGVPEISAETRLVAGTILAGWADGAPGLACETPALADSSGRAWPDGDRRSDISHPRRGWQAKGEPVMTHVHDDKTPPWKTDGVRVIKGDQLDSNTAQTPGMFRQAAINHARVGAQKIWAGTVTIAPNAKTGVHHHGALESVIFVLRGRARMRWGDRLEFVAEAEPGDFIYVPPYVPHQEINADPDQPLECVLVRSDNEAVVVNITDVDPVERPETVYWVDPIHRPPQA